MNIIGFFFISSILFVSLIWFYIDLIDSDSLGVKFGVESPETLYDGVGCCIIYIRVIGNKQVKHQPVFLFMNLMRCYLTKQLNAYTLSNNNSVFREIYLRQRSEV